MFSILQKSQESVNAEDLETLQNEIERSLVKIVTQKWELESELIGLSCTSPDQTNNNHPTSASSTTTATNTTTNSISGKLRNRNPVQDISENSSDCSKTTTSDPNNVANLGSASCTNSTEDSVSSEGSLVSSLTGSTIIAPSIADLGSQTQTTANTSSGTLKRSHKASNDRPSKRFRQNSNNSLTSTSGNLSKRPHSKHRSKIVPVSMIHQYNYSYILMFYM